MEGFGFSVGFFLVVLSGALLFTEANLEFPATLMDRRRSAGGPAAMGRAIARLWLLAAFGNVVGAVVLGRAIAATSSYGVGDAELLAEVVDGKLRFRETGGIDGFGRAVLSGMLGNWLVGMAAFLATMGRTIIGKYIPVLLTVMAVVAGGFLHSPANMAYLSLIQPLGIGPGWADGVPWAVLPAAIGNVVGAFLLVALPFWFAVTRRARRVGGPVV